MALTAAVGWSQDLEGSEAGIQAAQKALAQLGRSPTTLGFVVASPDFSIQQVIHGVLSQVGQVPLFGFTSPAVLTSSGRQARAVAVGAISSGEVAARSGWWPGTLVEGLAGSSPQSAAQRILQDLHLTRGEGILLFAGDGLAGNINQVAVQIDKLLGTEPAPDSGGQILMAGCLASGDLRLGRTYQIGGRESGSAGLAAAYLSGRIAAGVGINHGWTSVGAYSKVTRSKGPYLLDLDEQPASETYARLFGRRPREWSQPPLNELVRLYPLGIEEEIATQDSQPPDEPNRHERQVRHFVRAPLRMESDGSLRMNAPVAEGKTGYFLVGSVSSCQEAARLAARQALTQLRRAAGSPRPVLALVLVDIAWSMLMQAQPGEEILAVRSVIGEEVPILGGYTFGQVGRTGPAGEPELLNQQIEVVVFGGTFPGLDDSF